MADDEDIVMTPIKRPKGMCIRVVRKKRSVGDAGSVHHRGAAQNRGLVINKQGVDSSEDDEGPANLALEFRCFLENSKNGERIIENRKLKFWFTEGVENFHRMNAAYEFFKELVKPDSFPRDYVGFVKKTMKQMHHHRYPEIRKVDVELIPVEESDMLPTTGLPIQDNRTEQEKVREQLLLTLESAYPNILGMDDLMRILDADENTIQLALKDLQARNLVAEMEVGFVRHVIEDNKTEVKMVKTMPRLMFEKGDRPTIAIITANYNEKLAVDSMMERKTTFVRYKSEGESNVYTIGYVGPHKVISTKLPTVGRNMAAKISTGNTTTRLLGTFPDVEHVLMVGVAGGAAHLTDYYKHPRLGDIVVSSPNKFGEYIYCDKVIQKNESDPVSYKIQTWTSKEKDLLSIAHMLWDEYQANPMECMWKEFIEEGQQQLAVQEADFSRPAPNTDRLFMSLGGTEVIEASHPSVPDGVAMEGLPNIPKIRFGPVGTGRPVTKDDVLRQDFAAQYDVLAYDTEFDQVLLSIAGNRKDSFTFIRGVADYQDGQRNKEWQPYSALAAAAFMKSVLLRLAPVVTDD